MCFCENQLPYFQFQVFFPSFNFGQWLIKMRSIVYTSFPALPISSIRILVTLNLIMHIFELTRWNFRRLTIIVERKEKIFNWSLISDWIIFLVSPRTSVVKQSFIHIKKVSRLKLLPLDLNIISDWENHYSQEHNLFLQRKQPLLLKSWWNLRYPYPEKQDYMKF